jgi:hypothetical protein
MVVMRKETHEQKMKRFKEMKMEPCCFCKVVPVLHVNPEMRVCETFACAMRGVHLHVKDWNKYMLKAQPKTLSAMQIVKEVYSHLPPSNYPPTLTPLAMVHILAELYPEGIRVKPVKRRR